MSAQPSEHVVEQIETYLADGLSPDERLAFEAHVANCPACADVLAAARTADAELRDLFRAARPAPGFEDRLIRGLRQQGRSPRVALRHPAMLRTAAGIAATVLLAGTGVIVANAVDDHAGGARPGRALVSRLEFDRTEQSVRRQSNSLGQSFKSFPATQPGAKSELMGRVAQITSTATSASSFGDQPPQVLSNGREAGGRSYGLETTTWNMPHKPAESVPMFYKVNQVTDGLDGKVAVEGKDATKAGEVAMGGEALGAPQLQRRLGEPAIVEQEQRDAPASAQTPAGVPNTNGQFGAARPSEPPPPADASAQPLTAGRKVIRNGTVEFEVASFDDALIRITKLVNEQGGFIATTDSDKLPNGKVKGTVAVRVPPEHLDTLVLTLRGIGDLKTQKIAAEDVTKHYTDLESQRRAAQAMYDRLTDIIKTGKGQIKDLIEAEKQLGVWEEKLEQIKGEQRYLDNLIAYSTLTIELYEKDIKTPATASETEQVSLSLETEAVDQAYARARDVIAAAKGRVVQAELKQFDAGQFGANIQAALPPEQAEEAIARLRQIAGRIAHFSRDRRQTTQNGAAAPADVLHVNREDVVVSMQIYNLANIAPRLTTSAQVAAANVERAYRRIIEQVRSAGGRIVASTLAKPDGNQQSADVDIQLPADKADAVQEGLHALGEVMRQESTENPDTANVTEAKRGLHLRIVSLAAVPPREGRTIQLAAADVPAAYNEILNAVKAADGRVLQSDLNELDPHNVSGTLAFELARTSAPAVDAAIQKSAQVLTRVVSRSPDAENTVDTKLRMFLSLASAEGLAPRETVTVEREDVSDVQRAADDLVNAAVAAGGHRLGNGEVAQDQQGHASAHVIVDVPLNKLSAILDQVEREGYRVTRQVSFDNSVPDGALARGRIDATWTNTTAGPGAEESTWASIRRGLATSARGLRLSLQMIIVGLCFVAPWVLVLWVVWRVVRRGRRGTTPPVVAGA